MDAHLYQGLIYLCTRGNDDFITPLVKFISLYKKMRIEGNQVERIKLGKLTLWYIKLCLLKKVFPNEPMSQKQWEYVLPEIVSFIMNKENLLLLMDIDAYKTFQLLLILFVGEASRLLDTSVMVHIYVDEPYPIRVYT